MIRILDSRREEFRLSKAYEQKIDVVNVITAPEIEMLIIHAEGAYDQFKRSGKKPSEFCKTNLRMHDVKSYEIESSSMPRWETNGVFFALNQTIHSMEKVSYARFHMLFGFPPASGQESVSLVCPHCRL